MGKKNLPGNWKMGQNTPQAMGKDVLGTFMPHPGPGPGSGPGPGPGPPPMANPLGLRPRNLQYLLSYCCGGAQPNSCPVGERLVGCCSHCTTAIYLSTVHPAFPALLSTSHRGVRLLDRKNPQQLDQATLTEVS